jgi:ribosomal protein S16
MPVRIRFALHGRRNNRIFHLVAMNQRAARDSKPIETLGIYDPRLHLGQTHKTVEWSIERIKYWLAQGAQPSKSVVKLLELVRYFMDSKLRLRMTRLGILNRADSCRLIPNTTQRQVLENLLLTS